MDHAHGSSPPIPCTDESQYVSRRRPSYVARSTPSPPASTYQRLTSHQKRLQARNSGFSGTPITRNTVRGKLSQLFSGSEENGARHTRGRISDNATPGYSNILNTQYDHKIGPPFSILNEITNATHDRVSRKRTAIGLFEDDVGRPLLQTSPNTPVIYHDAPSSPFSPLDYKCAREDPDTMPLRSISGNEYRVSFPESPVLASSVRGNRKRTMNLRKTSLEASTYIDHLENQLQHIQEQLNSPRTGEPLEEKMKVMKVENKQLRKMIANLEHSFEGRVQDAVHHLTAAEGEYLRKLNGLEDELESKERAIEEYQYQSQYDHATIEALKSAMERLEEDKRSLEEDNRGLEKRNEVLAGLLALSPSRQQSSFTWNSPTRDMHKTPRPQSMVTTRFPTSPTAKQPTRPRSTLVSPAHSTFSYFSPRSVLEREHEHPCNDLENMDSDKVNGDSGSIDSGLGDSCSVQSAVHSTSKRSTLASQTSLSPSAWELPLPISPTEDQSTIRQHRRRKTRRFMSGSTQLKPLLLPSMNTDVNSSFQPSLIPSPLSLTRRDISDQSIDPTTSFISQPQDFGASVDAHVIASRDFSGAPLPYTKDQSEEPEENVDLVSPDTRCVERMDMVLTAEDPSFVDSTETEDDDNSFMSYISQSMVRSNASNSVGGLFTSCVTAQSSKPGQDGQSDFDAFQKSSEFETDVGSAGSADESSLRAEDRLAVILFKTEGKSPDGEPWHPRSPVRQRGNGSEQLSSKLTGPDRFSSSRKRRRSSSSSEEAGRSQSPATANQHPEPPLVQSQRSDESTYEPVADPVSDLVVSSAACRRNGQPRTRCISPIETLQKRNIVVKPMVSATVQTVYGTLSRYTSYIREFKRDPLALARKIIANVWCTNWKRFGKLSWWVLGLFLGSSTRQDIIDHTQMAAPDWDDFDGESIANRSCGQESSEANPCRSPQGSNNQKRHDKHVSFDASDRGYQTKGVRKVAKPIPKTAIDKSRGWGQSLYLWGKFSLAIMLAVGGAVVQGPAEMMKDCDKHGKSPWLRQRSSRPTTRLNPGPIASQGATFELSMDCDPGATPKPSEQEASKRVFSFRTPAVDEGWNRSDDSGGARPGASRDTGSMPPSSCNENAQPLQATEDLGTLRWMRSLDHHDFQVIDAANHSIAMTLENVERQPSRG